MWKDYLRGSTRKTKQEILEKGIYRIQAVKYDCRKEGSQEVNEREFVRYWCLEKAMAPHSSTLAWKIPWTEEPSRLQSMGLRKLDRTERLHFHFSLSCTGEGNGNPLQCSCLENPRDGGAWWATQEFVRYWCFHLSPSKMTI